LSTDFHSRLPDGIHRLDLGVAIVAFLGDKIVLSPKGSDKHVTLHLGLTSKKLDVHRTRRLKGGTESYETILTIPHEQLPAIAADLVPLMESALSKSLRPLRVGWMSRHKIMAEPAFHPSESDQADLTVVRKGRLTVDPARLAANMGKLEFLDDLFDLPYGQAFSLISLKKRNRPKIFGIGFRLSGPEGSPKLYWCSNKQLFKCLDTFQARFMAILTRIGQV
jgi:hypothetical protein